MLTRLANRVRRENASPDTPVDAIMPAAPTARTPDAAHHYSDDLDWTTISPTIDWAGGGLVTTAPDLARWVRGLWSNQVIDAEGLDELTRWTPGARFAPESGLRYDRYGLGMGRNVVEGIELLGHTGFI